MTLNATDCSTGAIFHERSSKNINGILLKAIMDQTKKTPWWLILTILIAVVVGIIVLGYLLLVVSGAFDAIISGL